MSGFWKLVRFTFEVVIMGYACWLIWKDNPTIKDLTWLCAMTLIQGLINEGKLNTLQEKLLK